MSTDRNKAMSKRLYEEVFGRGNLGAADEILAVECVNHGAGAPPSIGREQIGGTRRSRFPRDLGQSPVCPTSLLRTP